MNYTQTQINEMSDFDINLAVAKKLGHETKVYANKHSSFVEIKNEYNSWDCFEPCTNWNDIMPIAEGYHIEMNPAMGFAWHNLGGLVSENKNPRRAICEVFLMMEVN
jgi:hypothetical protein